MILGRGIRLTLLGAAVLDLLIFANATPAVVIAVAVGAMMMFMGMGLHYRPAAVTGMFIATLGAASAIDLTTLTLLGNLVTAMIGLLLPIAIITWIVLSSEESEDLPVDIATRQTLTAAAFGLGCLWSVPLVVMIIGLVHTGASLSITTTSEISIILITMTAAGVGLTFGAGGKRPIQTSTTGASELKKSTEGEGRPDQVKH